MRWITCLCALLCLGAAPADWQPVPDSDLLVMQLASGQRVVIQLAAAFAPVHVENIRRLAHAGWWTNATIVRVQDDYVVQWSNPADATRPLPPGVIDKPPAEYEFPTTAAAIHRLPYPDSYAPITGYQNGWPVASDGKTTWLVHCYGMVGAGRDMPPDTGAGDELYAVIGQAPRHLDRNIALVGRILDGMPALAALPRGTADMGFYANPVQRVPIQSITLTTDLPPAQRPHYQVMRTDSAAFTAYLTARANRGAPFFIKPAGAIDLCNAPVPIRPAK